MDFIWLEDSLEEVPIYILLVKLFQVLQVISNIHVFEMLFSNFSLN